MGNKAAWECVDELCRRIMNFHLRQTFRWNTILWFGRFSSSGACYQWSRRMAFPRSICQILTTVEKNVRVQAHNVHPQRR
jgi:hypothetical protein